jgi:hypothetical protein
MGEPNIDEDDNIPPTDLGEENSYLHDPLLEASHDDADDGDDGDLVDDTDEDDIDYDEGGGED